MKFTLKTFVILGAFFFNSLQAMEIKPYSEDDLYRLYVDQPVLKNWFSVCHRISDIANTHITPLLAVQTEVGNDNPRILSENEAYLLKGWQSFQETVNKLAGEGLCSLVSPAFQAQTTKIKKSILDKEFIYDHSYGVYKIKIVSSLHENFRDQKTIKHPLHISRSIDNLREQVLPLVAAKFPTALFLTFKTERALKSTYPVTELDIVEFCKQKSLEFAFDIEGLEGEDSLMEQQLSLVSKTNSENKELLTQLTLESLRLKRRLAAVRAQSNLAHNTIELFYLLSSIHDVYNISLRDSQSLREHNYYLKK